MSEIESRCIDLKQPALLCCRTSPTEGPKAHRYMPMSDLILLFHLTIHANND